MDVWKSFYDRAQSKTRVTAAPMSVSGVSWGQHRHHRDNPVEDSHNADHHPPPLPHV